MTLRSRMDRPTVAARAVALATSRGTSVMMALIVLFFTLRPTQDSVPSFNQLDKLYHAVAFLILVFPRTWRAFENWRKYALLAALLGAFIEVVQPTVGRSGELADLLANLVGIALGVLLALRLQGHRKAGLGRAIPRR